MANKLNVNKLETVLVHLKKIGDVVIYSKLK